MSDKVPSVFIVDDDQAVRSSISWLVKSVDLQAKEYRSATLFLKECHPDQSGCLILDIRMPEMSGLELQRRLIDAKVELPIIFLTGHGDVPMAVQAMKLGAMNFLAKPFSGQILLDNIHDAIELDAKRRGKRKEQEATFSLIDRLTDREKEIMHLVVEGKRSKTIGLDLGISFKTVELHRNKIMEKMEVASSVELATLITMLEATETAV